MTKGEGIRRERAHPRFVVEDQQGLVVVWSDQHCSRFSWEALRHVCLCAEYQEHNGGRHPVSRHQNSPRGTTKE